MIGTGHELLAMAVAETPVDLVGVKRAAPSARPGTVARAAVCDVSGRCRPRIAAAGACRSPARRWCADHRVFAATPCSPIRRGSGRTTTVGSPRDGRRRSSLRSRGVKLRRAIGPAEASLKANAIGPAVRVDLSPFANVIAPAKDIARKRRCLPKWAGLPSESVGVKVAALDGRDDDAVVFLGFIAATVHGVDPVQGRGVRTRCRAPGGSHLGQPRAQRVGSALGGACRAPAQVLVLDDLHSRRQPVLSGRARRAWSSTFRPARRSRSPGREGPGTPACPLAGARPGCTRSAWRTFGWTSRRPGCCLKLPESSWTRARFSELTEQTEGWPAGLYLAALSLQAGSAEPRGGRRA